MQTTRRSPKTKEAIWGGSFSVSDWQVISSGNSASFPLSTHQNGACERPGEEEKREREKASERQPRAKKSDRCKGTWALCRLDVGWLVCCLPVCVCDSGRMAHTYWRGTTTPRGIKWAKMSPERENNQKEHQKWRSESTPAAALKQLLLLVNFPKWKEWRTFPSFSLAFFNTSGGSAHSWILFHIKVRITVFRCGSILWSIFKTCSLQSRFYSVWIISSHKKVYFLRLFLGKRISPQQVHIIPRLTAFSVIKND